MDESGGETGGAEKRREDRDSPYPYLPHVIIQPDDERDVTGFIRNVSKKGFSAQFEQGFPYVEGDVLDVQVGFQRAWARVVWVEHVLENIDVVGFELHPEDYLDTRLANDNADQSE
jgi:hypothetical protein